MSGVAAGKLRHRIKIQSQRRVQDPLTGEMKVEWEDFATVWGSVEPLSVREFIQSQSTQSEISARITIRHRYGLTPDMRLVHRGNIYNPAGMLPDADSGLEHITIPVKAGVNDGQ